MNSIPFCKRSCPAVYAIVNVENHSDPSGFARALFESGVQLLQLRSKGSEDGALLKLYREVVKMAAAFARTKKSAPWVIINDRPDLCLASGAHGVHVGQGDLPVYEVRKILGATAIVGLSTHTDEQFQAACNELVNYIAVGPIFLSPTKSGHAEVVATDRLARRISNTEIPVVAIGGITLENAESVYRSGARSVALISDLERSTDPAASILAYAKVRAAGETA